MMIAFSLLQDDDDCNDDVIEEADVDIDGVDDDVEDVNQKTKHEQVEAQLGPFWGVRQHQI